MNNEHARSLRDLERAVASSDLGARDFLAVMEPGTHYAYGSAVRSLASQLVLAPSGLFLPPALVRPQQPLDLVNTFITPDELFGEVLTTLGILEHLRVIPVDHAIAWAASLLCELHAPRADRRKIEAAFINSHFAGSLRTRAHNILRDPQRALLIPQALIVFIKLALVFSRTDGHPDRTDERLLVTALLNIPAHLDADIAHLREVEELVLVGEPDEFGRYFIANQMFNSRKDAASAFAVFQRCWREIPTEAASDDRVVDLDRVYREATGVTLDDLLVVCGYLWARSATGTATVQISELVALGWESDRLDATLRLMSATPAQLSQMLRDEADSHGVVWTTKTFEWFPVVRWPNHLTVLDPELLVGRSTGLWPLFDIKREMYRDGRRSQADAAAGCVHYSFERFALESLAAIVGAQRFYPEHELKRAYGKGRVADAAADYGVAWVVADVTITGFQLKTAAGTSGESVVQDIDHVVDKARQIESTIGNLRRDQSKLTGRKESAVHVRFYPVVVVAGRFAASPVTLTMLREQLSKANVLQAPDVERLEVMELEDLLAVEGTCETGGPSLVDMLSKKAQSPMSLMSMREFLREELGQPGSHPERVTSRWRAWFKPVEDALRRNGFE